MFTPQNKRLVTSFNKKSDQCVTAHLFGFYIKKFASVFRLFTPQNKFLLTSFNKKNDQCIAAHLFGFNRLRAFRRARVFGKMACGVEGFMFLVKCRENVDAKMLKNLRQNVCKNMQKLIRKSTKIMKNPSKIGLKST